MSEIPTCGMTAMFRFTWPGKDESFVCYGHAHRLKLTANALGFQLQIIGLDPLEMSLHTCQQKEPVHV